MVGQKPVAIVGRLLQPMESFSRGESIMTEENQKAEVRSFIAPITIAIVVTVFVLAYIGAAWFPETVHSVFQVREGTDPAKKFDVFGPIGDFFGGVINPILTFITICLLLQSIKIQTLELAATRSELARTAKASEDMVKIQNVQIERAIQSANALSDAAAAQIGSSESQRKLTKLQRSMIIMEVKAIQLEQNGIKLDRLYRERDFIVRENNLAFLSNGRTNQDLVNEHIKHAEDERSKLEKEINNIGNNLRYEDFFSR